MKPAICTQCGGRIEVDETKEAGICAHCGTAFITEKVINNYTTNFNTVHNVTENITKIIYGNEKDEGDDFYKRGLTLLKQEEWYKAEQAFEKAIELSPEKINYRFYLTVAQTENFSNLFMLYQEKGYIVGTYAHTVQDKNLLKFFKFATKEEKEQFSKEYGFDFSNDKDFTVSVVKRLIEGELDKKIDDFIWLLLENVDDESAKKMAKNIYDFITDGEKTGGYFDDYLDWAIDILPKEKVSSVQNVVKNGTFIIRNVDALPANNGVFSVPTPTVTKIELALDSLATKMQKKFKKFLVTKNIKWAQLNTFEIIEFEEGYNENNMETIALRATKAVILPKSATKVTFHPKNHAFIYCKGAIENIGYRHDVNDYFTGKYSHSRYYSSGIVMGNAVFYPLVSERCYKFDKKYKWSKKLPNDAWENADEFIKNVEHVLGFNFLKGKKVLTLPPEKQYKKALKLNK